MINWTVLSKTDNHEIWNGIGNEGTWQTSTNVASSEFRICFMPNHPEGLSAKQVVDRKLSLDRNDRVGHDNLSLYLQPRNIGLAGSMTEAKLVCEMLDQVRNVPDYEEAYSSAGMTLRHSFENDRGEFFFSNHPAHQNLEITTGPEMVSCTYETPRGSEFIVILYDPEKSAQTIAYPNHISDYRGNALDCFFEIIKLRKEAESIKKPLA